MAITLTCTGCGKSYQLKNEMAGRKVRCPGCQSVQVVPEDITEDTTVRLTVLEFAASFYS